MNHLLSLHRPDMRAAARSVILILLGVAFLTLCAKIRLPSWPVPMTLQTLGVMSLAIAAGPRLAAATFAAYLAAGAIGMPVFAGTPERGIGLAYMAGPTGGYLLGFLTASWLVGTLMTWFGRGILGRSLAMVAGLGVVYGAGLAWLSFYVPANQLLALGMLPFIMSDLTSIAVVTLGASAISAAISAAFPALLDKLADWMPRR